MFSTTRVRAVQGLAPLRRLSQRSLSMSSRHFKAQAPVPNKNSKNANNVASPSDAATTPVVFEEQANVPQSPNRAEVWSKSQQTRQAAMTGPRFEQTDFDKQPKPWSAMALAHEQPLTWTYDRIVSCDGGGGPAGHPQIFINTDKPEIAVCGYCSKPFANLHNREHLKSLYETPNSSSD